MTDIEIFTTTYLYLIPVEDKQLKVVPYIVNQKYIPLSLLQKCHLNAPIVAKYKRKKHPYLVYPSHKLSVPQRPP